MSWHPLALALSLTDLLSWGIYLSAAWRLVDIIVHWRPDEGSFNQLRREQALDLTVYQGRWVLGMQILGLALLVAGISNGWPAHVDGAMCGTGVLQAMGRYGWQSVAFRCLTVLVLFCWQVVSAIDDGHPRSPLAMPKARLLLTAAPVMGWSTIASWRAVSALQGAPPVSCCAVVYDRATDVGWGITTIQPMLPARDWLVLGLGFSLVLLGWGAWKWRRPTGGPRRHLLFFLPLLSAWLYCAVQAIRFGVSPYIYQVLFHPCPWCLFLDTYWFAGVVIFGLPAVIVAECLALLTAAAIARRHNDLLSRAHDRVRHAGLRVMLFTAALLVVTAAPVLLWRLRFGGWID